MEKLIRFGWLRRGGFWAALILLVASVFSVSEPAEAARSRRSQVRSTRQERVVRNRRSMRNRSLRASRRYRRGRMITVDLSSQRLVAWENGRPVYSFRVSTGKRAAPTPTGTYAVQTKLRSTTMRSRRWGYNVANVPYTMYYSGGYAIHGAYWHNRFGTRVSHGCVNLPVSQARKLYSWASVGTPIVVHQ